MTGAFRIRRAEERDYPVITEIAGACFIGSIREYYGPGGAMAFGAYIQPSAIRARREEEKDLVLLVAEREGETLGVAELRERNHLSMLFVAPAYQNCGVGHALLTGIIRAAHRREPELRDLTVYAVPGAVEIYEHWGFVPTGEMESVQEICFVPMRLELFKSGNQIKHDRDVTR